MKIGDVKNTILDGLRPFAEENGFKVNKGKFGIFLKEKERISSIDFSYCTWGFYVDLYPHVKIKFKVIHEICEQCGYNLNYTAFINLFELEDIQKHGLLWNLFTKEPWTNRDRITLLDCGNDFWVERLRKENPDSENQIMLVDNGWGERCNKRIEELLPYAVDYIDRYSDIEAIDRLYNTFPINFRNPNCSSSISNSVIGLISAKLSHNPRYDKIKETYTAIIKKECYYEETRQSFFRIIDYLDNTAL